MKKIKVLRNLATALFLLQFTNAAIGAPTAPPPLPPIKKQPPPLPGNNPPPLPSPGTCQTTPDLPGCPPRLPPGTPSSGKLRGINYKFNHEANGEAPGIAEYKALGYCTGIKDGPTYSYSLSAKEKTKTASSEDVRTYFLRITSDSIDKSIDKPFMKVALSQIEDGSSCGNLSHFSNEELTAKSRPVNAPPLFFIEGETAKIVVRNDSNSPITIHWHGLILPNDQDGVPGITQPPIQPKSEFIYHFKLKQNGTYWYHPHDLNEQHVKGAFIIFPKPGKEMIAMKSTATPNYETRYHHDRTILLTDYKKREPLKILNQLRNNQYMYAFDSKITRGLIEQFQCFDEFMGNLRNMKMFWMDKADVWYDYFFVNDETCLNCGSLTNYLEKPHREKAGQIFPSVDEFSKLKTGDRVRLRIINSSASTYFFIDYGDSGSLAADQKTDMLVVAKDGEPVEPTYTDQLYMGMGETYDVIVDIPEANTAYELRVKSIDDFHSERLARVLIGNTDESAVSGLSLFGFNLFGDNAGNTNSPIMLKQAFDMPVQLCGLLPNDLPNQLSYPALNRRFEKDVVDEFPYAKGTKVVNFNIELSGNMDDYFWKIDGESGTKIEIDPNGTPYINIVEGARNRFYIKNTMVMGMMNHPWHLHGTFFRLIDPDDIGEPNEDELIAHKPLMHTATIFPNDTKTMIIEVYADPKTRGAWMFHCHNLYHMANVMMMYLKYDTFDGKNLPHMHPVGESYSGQKDNWSWWDSIVNVTGQYVTVGAGSHIGTNGNGVDVQFNYRANLAGNKGYINAMISALKSIDGDQELSINTTISHCLRVNECIYVDLDIENRKDSKRSSALVGKTIRFNNSEYKVFDGAIGVEKNTDIETNKSTISPAARLTGAYTIPIGWNITATARAGCEHAYCATAFAEFMAKLKASPNITFTLLNCKGSTDADDTGCFANVMIGSDPFPFGQGSH